MNPVDHPHGGGEGKTSGGRHPVNPQGKPEGRTRRKGQPSDRSSTATIISLLRRACQIKGVRRRRNFSSFATAIRAIPSGASGPSHAARNNWASFGATMRLVAVTPE